MARPSRGERESIAFSRKNDAFDRPIRFNRSFTDISSCSNRSASLLRQGFLPGPGEFSRTEQYSQIRPKNKDEKSPPALQSCPAAFRLFLDIPHNRLTIAPSS